ncbi:unnamed protein product, partial [Hapterophycus canaliculatus]
IIWNLGSCYQAVLNDARIIELDPALQSKLEILYAYPGFWALFWYRISHALLEREIPLLSAFMPRFIMSVVRYATAIDIHPAAKISADGVLIDHGVGLVVGETAVIGAQVTLYHGVTLGNSGKKVLPGMKRHPTIGDRVVVGAGAKILGDIVIGDDVLVGANSIVTKPVPANHTAVGIPARILCHGAAPGRDVAGAAICELHRRLQKVETARSDAVSVASAPVPAEDQPAGSGVTEVPSPRREKLAQQEQKQRQQKQLLPTPPRPETGVGQILYSEAALLAG